MVRIAHVITKLELGGAQKNTLYTVKNLALEKNAESYLICGQGGILDNETGKLKNVTTIFVDSLVREINPLKDLITFFKLLKIFKKYKFDIIHTHSSKAGILGRLAAKLSGTPLIYHTIHGWGITDTQPYPIRKIFIFLERLCARFTEKLIPVSYENIKKGLRWRIGSKDKYTVIRSGIDFSDFDKVQDISSLKKEYGISDETVVTNISCFKPQKCLTDFILIADKCIKKNDRFKFLLVGDGEQRREIESVINKYNLSDKIVLTGWSYNTPAILELTDIFVLTSLWEGLPRSILEAFAKKKPVVATGVDGTVEIVIPGETGFLFEPHDIDKAANSICELAGDKNKQAVMGEEGYKKVVNEFSIQKMYSDILKIYGDGLSSF